MIQPILLIAAICSAGVDSTAAPTGALLGWTSPDRIVVQARDLVQAGRLADAGRLLADSAEEEEDPAAKQARREMAEIIRRIRLDYSLDQAALLARLKESLPDVTSEDLTRWRQGGQVRFRAIDGEIRYLKSEPANMFRFCAEAKQRLAKRSPESTPAAVDARKKARLREHLAQVIAAADQSGKTEVMPVKHRVRYKLTVRPDRTDASAGSVVRCWLPFPQEYRQQKNVRLIRTSPAERVVAPTAGDGPPIQGSPQRTVYLEQKRDDPGKPMVFEEEFEYTSYAYYPRLRESEARELPSGFDRVYLSERPPHIVFTPRIRETVRDVVGQETNPLTKLRKIYHYLAGRIRWGPEEEYAIIPNFSMKPLTTGQGDCGLQSMLLITLCRAAGIPARWQSGWETRPWAWDMHDWAEVYIEPWGWLPVDQSYGLQLSDDPRIREFYIGHQDAYRLIVNLDYGSPLTPPKADMRSEPADFQRGEVEIDGRNLYYDGWDYSIAFDWEPPPSPPPAQP